MGGPVSGRAPLTSADPAEEPPGSIRPSVQGTGGSSGRTTTWGIGSDIATSGTIDMRCVRPVPRT